MTPLMLSSYALDTPPSYPTPFTPPTSPTPNPMNNSAKTLLMLTVTRTCYFSIPPTLTPPLIPSAPFIFPPSPFSNPLPPSAFPVTPLSELLMINALTSCKAPVFHWTGRRCFLIHAFLCIAVVRSFTHNCTTFFTKDLLVHIVALMYEEKKDILP